MRRQTQRILLLVILFVFITLACNAPWFDVEQPNINPSATVGPEKGQLQPGGSFTGREGVTVRALPDSISNPIDVEVKPIDPPTDKNPLPTNITASGPFLRLSASERTFTPSRSPFSISVPVDGGQVDAEHLALAVLVPGEEIHFQAECTAEDCSALGPGDAWFPVSGVYRPQSSRFETALPFLAREGRTVVLVESQDYSSPAVPAGQGWYRDTTTSRFQKYCLSASALSGLLCSMGSAFPSAVMPQNQSSSFRAYCRNFGSSNINCGNSETTAIEDEVTANYADLTGVGFGDPYLGLDSNGDYELEIRPFWEGDSDIDNLDSCEVVDEGRNLGMYNSNTRTFIVCIGDRGVTDRTRSIARHEYFHATQYGYAGFRNSPKDKWVVEGTATAAENSLNTFGRDLGRDLHQIDVSLKEDQGFIEYQAQDFWVYLGLFFEQSSAGINLGYLVDVFMEGKDAAAVDQALQNSPTYPLSLDLPQAYWRWARNQFYLQSVQSGVDGPGSQINEDVATLQQVNVNPGSSQNVATFQLDPLDSAALEVTFSGDPSQSYSRLLRVDSSSDMLRSEFYELDSSATSCIGSGYLASLQATIPPGGEKTYYALISNTDYDQSASFTLVAETIGLDITQPADGTQYTEGQNIKFTAETEGICESNDSLPRIYWSYPRYDGVPVTFGSTKSGGSIFKHDFCDGTYTVEARALNAAGQEVATDEVSVVIQNPDGPPPASCALEIDILSPRANSSYRVGDTIQLRAAIDDDHPETSNPITTILWRSNGPDGTIIGRGLNASTKLGEGVTQVYVEYGWASDSVGLSIVETENEPPRAFIDQPGPGSNFSYTDPGAGSTGVTVDFVGRGVDPEDGMLSGSNMVWSYRPAGASSWTEMGTGRTVSHTFRYTSGWAYYEILLEVVDSEGLSGDESTETIEIGIQGPPS